MAKSFEAFLQKFNANGPASTEALNGVETHYGFALPDQYKSLLGAHDGGEGFVGVHYLILWRASELIDFNREYEVAKYAPGLLIFGSDGGGEGFAFDTREGEKMKIRIVPFIGMRLKDAKFLADTFEGFLVRLAESAGSLL